MTKRKKARSKHPSYPRKAGRRQNKLTRISILTLFIVAIEVIGLNIWLRTTQPVMSVLALNSSSVLAPPNSLPARYTAPYVDLTQPPVFSMTQAAKDTGQKYWAMAFITSKPKCTASWGGGSSVASSRLGVDDLQSLRGLGGEAIVSFGGAGGVELAQSCSSVNSLEDQYKMVISKYKVAHLDFDIEGAATADKTSITRRNQAIADLQKNWASANGYNLVVSYTLLVQTTGLPADSLAVLKDAVATGVVVSRVNIMAMDYGKADLPKPQGKMGAAAIQAAQSTFGQLKNLFAGYSDSRVWTTIGLTPLIGLNDVKDEIFYQADARQVLAFAQNQNIGMLSFWAGQRDWQCPKPVKRAVGYCSGITQTKYEFTTIFEPFSQ